DNLLHVAADYYYMINAIKGSVVGYTGNDDSLRKKFPAKIDIVKYLKQAVADGAQLIKEQGDSGLTREFKFPWGNFMAHGSFGWNGSLEHAGEHYGQLVVYYRVNGMIPPDSRPKK
ncbi:MAG: DinB family protein, partial [Bacteroidota bacterium]